MNKKFTFKNLKKEYSEQIYELQKNNQNDFGNNIWETEELNDSISKNLFNGQVFISKKRVEGFLLYKIIDNYIEIYSLFVEPKFRKKGIARNFLKNCIKFCKEKNLVKIILDVNEKNLIALRFYRKNNFLFCGMRKDYYKDKNFYNDSYTMSLLI